MGFDSVFEKEKLFSANNYHGGLFDGTELIYRKGTLPIIISAPHSTFQIRNGNYKLPEPYTASIGWILNELLNVHFIAKTHSYGADPNSSSHSFYRDYLAHVVSNNNIHLVLDLHGAAERHPFSLDLGTVDGKTASPETITLLKSTLVEKIPYPFIVGENHTFNAFSSPYTVTNNIFERTECETIQLEINRKFRRPEDNFNEFISFLQGLASFIDIYNYLYKNKHSR